MLNISEELLSQIRVHALRDYPNECCGALLGRMSEVGRDVVDLLPLTNRRSDSLRNRFILTPEDFLEAEQRAAAQKLEVLGWYHSHPDHPARPSDYDREHAWPWYSYLIVAVTAHAANEITSWQLEENRKNFRREEIRVFLPVQT